MSRCHFPLIIIFIAKITDGFTWTIWNFLMFNDAFIQFRNAWYLPYLNLGFREFRKSEVHCTFLINISVPINLLNINFKYHYIWHICYFNPNKTLIHIWKHWLYFSVKHQGPQLMVADTEGSRTTLFTPSYLIVLDLLNALISNDFFLVNFKFL